eukprot:scaffold138796_cov21-Prasinocladus_malaysianus.AAC.1
MSHINAHASTARTENGAHAYQKDGQMQRCFQQQADGNDTLMLVLREEETDSLTGGVDRAVTCLVGEAGQYLPRKASIRPGNRCATLRSSSA